MKNTVCKLKNEDEIDVFQKSQLKFEYSVYLLKFDYSVYLLNYRNKSEEPKKPKLGV